MEITSGCSKCAVPQIKWCPQKPKNRRAPGPLKPPRVAKVKKWNTKNPPQGWCVAFFLWPIRKYFVSCFVPFCILPLKMKRKAAWGAHIKHTENQRQEQDAGHSCHLKFIFIEICLGKWCQENKICVSDLQLELLWIETIFEDGGWLNQCQVFQSLRWPKFSQYKRKELKRNAIWELITINGCKYYFKYSFTLESSLL